MYAKYRTLDEKYKTGKIFSSKNHKGEMVDHIQNFYDKNGNTTKTIVHYRSV